MNDRFEDSLSCFREMNAQDTRRSSIGDAEHPTQLLEAERLALWVARVAPEASEALRLAAHCQHLMRFRFPRSEYPEGRTGYLLWRKDLMKRHADLASEVLRKQGYESELIEAVRQINLKLDRGHNPDTQAMEDALCLSFLEHDLAAFVEKYDDEKVVDVIRKSWKKMSQTGQHLALALTLPKRQGKLVEEALGG